MRDYHSDNSNKAFTSAAAFERVHSSLRFCKTDLL